MINNKRSNIKPGHWLLLLFILVTVQYCTEPYEFDIEAEESVLVVDGFITDQNRAQLIRLSRSNSIIANIGEIDPVTSAQVSIVDDLGGRIQAIHSGNGDYFTPPFAAEEGRSYQLVIGLGSQTYQSNFQSLPAANFTPELEIVPNTGDFREVIQGSAIIERQGVSVQARIDKSVITDREPVRYQWFMRACRSGNFCGVEGNVATSELYLHQDNYVAGRENQSYFFELNWIPKRFNPGNDDLLTLEIQQVIITAQAFDFWSRIKRSIDSRGTIFDPQGARILGNVENAESGNATLGFFGVYREASNTETITLRGW